MSSNEPFKLETSLFSAFLHFQFPRFKVNEEKWKRNFTETLDGSTLASCPPPPSLVVTGFKGFISAAVRQTFFD